MAPNQPVPVVSNVARTGHSQDHINTLVLSIVRIRLFDPFQEPMPNAPYRLTLGERVIQGNADDRGWLEFRTLAVPESGMIEWGEKNPDELPYIPQRTPSPVAPDAESGQGADDTSTDPAGKSDQASNSDGSNSDPLEHEKVAAVAPRQPGPYLYEQDIHLEFHTEDEAEAARKRLHNLGFNMRKTLEENVRAFQQAYDRPLTGKMSDIKSDLWCWHDHCQPEAVLTPEMKDTAV